MFTFLRKKKIQIINIRIEVKIINTDQMHIERLIKEQYEKFYDYSLITYMKRTNFLKASSLSRFREDIRDNLNSHQSIEETDSMILILKTKSTKTKCFHREFYETFKEELL